MAYFVDNPAEPAQPIQPANSPEPTGRAPATQPLVPATRVTPSDDPTRLYGTMGIRPDGAQKSLGDIENDNKAIIDALIARDPFAREKLGKIWTTMRMDPRYDRGQDLERLLPLLEKNPELLDQIYKLCMTERLFGITKDDTNAASFEAMRREYLTEVVLEAVDHRNLGVTQGPKALCTVTGLVLDLPPEELLRLTCEFACNGTVTTKGGQQITLDPSHVALAQRDIGGQLGDIRCRRTSFGLQVFLRGVGGIVGADLDRQGGLYWNQYTDVRRSLTGVDCVCYAHDATRDGKTTFDALCGDLARRDPNAAGGIPIDTLWNHAGHGEHPDSMHARHMILAKGIVPGLPSDLASRVPPELRNGEFVVCENPIGAFVDPTRSGAGESRYYPEGTVLGSRSGFWFVTGPGGTVYVRKDVLQENLRTVLVDTGGPFDPATIGSPRGVGTLDSGPVYYIEPDDYVVECVSHGSRRTNVETLAVSGEQAPISTEYQASRENGERRAPQMRRPKGAKTEWYEGEATAHFEAPVPPTTAGEDFWDAERGAWVSAQPEPDARPVRRVPSEFQTTAMPKAHANPTPDERGFLESKVDPAPPPEPIRTSAFNRAPSTEGGVGSRAFGYGRDRFSAFTADTDRSFKAKT